MPESKLKVLVAEDDKFLSKAYAAKLKKSGFDVTLVGNGEEALNHIKKSRPDAILLDLMMPVKDGFDTLFELKSDENLKSIPVIVLSNLGQPEDVDRAKKLGADDYLVKSNISMKDVVDKIKAVVVKKSS